MVQADWNTLTREKINGTLGGFIGVIIIAQELALDELHKSVLQSLLKLKGYKVHSYGFNLPYTHIFCCSKPNL